MQLPIAEFSGEQQEVWNRVAELWGLAKGRDDERPSGDISRLLSLECLWQS